MSAKPATAKTPTFSSTNPVTGTVIDTYPVFSRAQVTAAVARAKTAAPGWRATPLAQRLAIIQRARIALARNASAAGALISAETGKPHFESLALEVFPTVDLMHWCEKHAPRHLAERREPTPWYLPFKKSRIWYEPHGVVALISPWNFPFFLTFGPLIQALVTGNTVVLKCSSTTPGSGRIAAELFKEAGLPTGVLEVVTGPGKVGSWMLEEPIDFIFFTGSTEVGKGVLRTAADRVIPAGMELGGKNPFIVCADAQLERAARGALWGGLCNSGQLCIAAGRIYVEAVVWKPFLEQVQRLGRELIVGGPGDTRADIGTMITAGQCAVVKRHLADARRKGATVVELPITLPAAGRFLQPTIVWGITDDMRMAREETFGPVLAIYKVKDWQEAVRRANDSPYGLTASVWTRDLVKGRTIAHAFQAGTVMINNCVAIIGNPGLPFGGVKQSGLGRYHGREGLWQFSRIKAVMEETSTDREMHWYPYTAQKERIIGTIIEVFYGNRHAPWAWVRFLRATVRYLQLRKM